MKPKWKVGSVLILLTIGILFLYILLKMTLTATGMHCWVKVIDQNGKPVSGYKCQTVQHGSSIWTFISGKSAVRMYVTDTDGEFEYNSYGPASCVVFGYWDNQWKFNPSNLVEASNLAVTSFEHQQGVQHEPNGFLGSRKNPYLIHVISVGPPQKLLYWEKKVRLKEPMNYACFDVLSGNIWENDKPEGDIAIKDNPYTDENIKNQTFQKFVTSKDCAIYPILDDWGLEPPETGYRSELYYDRDWLALRSRAGYTIHGVYFRLNCGPHGNYLYGRLELSGSGRISHEEVKCYLNLQGERNLFYKGYVRDYNPLPGPIQDYISPPVSLPLEKPSEAKPSEAK